MNRCLERFHVVFPILTIFVLFCSINPLSSQNKRPGIIKEDTIVKFKDRWSFRTNAVGWLLTVPNAAVEFDLTNSVYNKLTLGVEGKYNGYTMHNHLPYNVFNYWEVKPEIRKYWRTEYRPKTGNKPTLRERLFSKQREKPRYWRAYYMGGYVNAGGYDFKFSDEGIRGEYIGAGLTAGYSVPLYSYKSGAIDLEFGGNIGLMVTKNSGFRLDIENNEYIPTANVKNWHMVPFPVITDLRVAFVFRFNSIKDKYKRTDYEKIRMREAAKVEKKRQKDSIRVARHLEDSLQDLRKKFVKDSIKAARLLQDSLEDARKAFVKDSLENVKKLEAAGERKRGKKDDEDKSTDNVPLKTEDENNDALIKKED